MRSADFLKAHTMKPNPKRRKRRSSSTKRARRANAATTARRPARSRRKETTLRAFKLGTVLRVIYKHRQDGTRRFHDFKRGTPIAFTADRKFLIIPAPVKDFIE